MKIWHDDVRHPPSGWKWLTNNRATKSFLRRYDVEAISLDHDLGGKETGLDLVEWMVEHNHLPESIHIHSWNAPGAKRMADTLKSAGKTPTVKPYG